MVGFGIAWGAVNCWTEKYQHPDRWNQIPGFLFPKRNYQSYLSFINGIATKQKYPFGNAESWNALSSGFALRWPWQPSHNIFVLA